MITGRDTSRILHLGRLSSVVSKVPACNDQFFGCNTATGVFEDLVKVGVIDPTKGWHALLCRTQLRLPRFFSHWSNGCRDSRTKGCGAGRRIL